MSIPPTDPFDPNDLCAHVSLAQGEDPIGSASHFEHCLLIEVPPPWPRKIWQARQVPDNLKAVLSALEAANVSFKALGILPDPDYSCPQQAGLSRVIHYWRAEAMAPSYQKVEYCLPLEQVAPLLEALFGLKGQPDDFSAWRLADEAYNDSNNQTRDLFVCTQGSRDSSCGTLGYPLYRVLREQYAAQWPDLRVWRVSHLGGHRFAATMLDFPNGHYWGRLSPETLPILIENLGNLADLMPYYRGWCALPELAQVAEAELWREFGWDWLAYPRRAEVLSDDVAGAGASVAFTFQPAATANPETRQVQIRFRDQVLIMPSTGKAEREMVNRYHTKVQHQFSADL